ncbi:molybdenum cofactor biosynthesis protein MoaE [Pimelobacter simplex]|uniref:molybdenum cofactor biosynthesis protein MoaE n=1 Tax=Nocardioides simplex TaxID=2045 RepID=UPI00214FD85F|nr:molybdenum cofactor biosynthesis protein MoaE [Pimelobacter simplex]UUW92521.1 molybdenum cofactor biosynthesis protein MoaE [Pimelobacter simplex]UUW96349.1 molybdenum cofactor biosynthesis protein MoaE [Pimelobacter simplex]
MPTNDIEFEAVDPITVSADPITASTTLCRVSVRVQKHPIDAVAVRALIDDERAGAIASFEGQIRLYDDGQPVSVVEYSAHPTAQAVLERLAAEVMEDVAPEARLAIRHRVGRLAVGDVALFVAASSPHRKDAFDLCHLATETVKAELPIWKYQIFTDGSHEWVACL